MRQQSLRRLTDNPRPKIVVLRNLRDRAVQCCHRLLQVIANSTRDGRAITGRTRYYYSAAHTTLSEHKSQISLLGRIELHCRVTPEAQAVGSGLLEQIGLLQ